uniref:uncharacterized protein LOC120328947 n=1 Tax=Styela clava TaxID=7725 RepID=UPI00193A57B4|nr:uncharacterized protein LOC120328947 [Styela clava]XP_039251468.1 uncharacterized protein LOC120328947 [Styela clava]
MATRENEMFKNMKIIVAIVLCWICLSSCKKVPRPQCIHKINGTNGVVKFPGMLFNDKAKELFTEGRKMGRICIIHGKIPENNDLILKIDHPVALQNWISVGGKIPEYGDWENMAILYYNDQGSVDMHTAHQYSTFARDGENGTKEIMLPGYKFGHVRIVFPRKKTNLIITYSWTDTREMVFSRQTGFLKFQFNQASIVLSGFDGSLPIQKFPIQIVEPGVKEWYRAILIYPEIVVDFRKEELMNSHKCLSLENLADCFEGKSRFVTHWIDSCDYPIDYLLELFGEDGDSGIDPDTIPAPTKLTLKDQIRKMDSEAKLQLFMKLFLSNGKDIFIISLE